MSTRKWKGTALDQLRGAGFGLVNGMGSAGRKYKAVQINRSDVMAAEGFTTI